MRITNLEWDQENVVHIARHRVGPEEVEELCFHRSPLIERGRGGLYYVTGQTRSGRYLFAVVRTLGRGMARVITAREMELKEKRRFRQMKGG